MENGVEIKQASVSEMPVITNLLQLYLYEFSDSMQTDLDDDGRYCWDGLEDYWTQDGLHAFLVRVEGHLAGFALVQRFSVVSQTQTCWDMEDFFVLAKYRRKGVGRCFAAHLFEAFTGAWEVRVLGGNTRASEFWHNAIAAHCNEPVHPVPIQLNQREFMVYQFETVGEPRRFE